MVFDEVQVNPSAERFEAFSAEFEEQERVLADLAQQREDRHNEARVALLTTMIGFALEHLSRGERKLARLALTNALEDSATYGNWQQAA